MTDDYTHKKGIVYKNQFYIIFCPKYRRKVLVNGVDERLKEILFGIAREKDVEIKALKSLIILCKVILGSKSMNI